MNKINNKFALIILVSTLSLGSVACNNARTSADAPSNINDEVTEPQKVEQTEQDATNPIRQDQLNSDIRAREQRNDQIGNPLDRTKSDLESEVRSKLEANIPGGKLTVNAEEEGLVTIFGSVPSSNDYAKIEPLAYEILGVKKVNLDVDIAEPN